MDVEGWGQNILALMHSSHKTPVSAHLTVSPPRIPRVFHFSARNSFNPPRLFRLPESATDYHHLHNRIPRLRFQFPPHPDQFRECE